MKDLMPGFTELHIAKVADGSFVLRTDNQVVVTAQNFSQVKKLAASFFDIDRKDTGEVVSSPE